MSDNIIDRVIDEGVEFEEMNEDSIKLKLLRVQYDKLLEASDRESDRSNEIISSLIEENEALKILVRKYIGD